MLNKQPRLRPQPSRVLGSLMLRVGLILSVLMLTGCTVVVTPHQPPLVLAPISRPPLVDNAGVFTTDGAVWLQDLVNAYLRNCVTLRVLRGEDPVICDKGLR